MCHGGSHTSLQTSHPGFTEHDVAETGNRDESCWLSQFWMKHILMSPLATLSRTTLIAVSGALAPMGIPC
eukprot:8855858-Prorocentrum_lima.AAC.1